MHLISVVIAAFQAHYALGGILTAKMLMGQEKVQSSLSGHAVGKTTDSSQSPAATDMRLIYRPMNG